jgi:hypothetical protein
MNTNATVPYEETCKKLDEEVARITRAITVKKVGGLAYRWIGYGPQKTTATVPVTFEFEGEQFNVYFQRDAEYCFMLAEECDDVTRLLRAVGYKYGLNPQITFMCIQNAGRPAAEAVYEAHYPLDDGDPDKMREKGLCVLAAHCVLDGRDIKGYEHNGLEMLDVCDSNAGTARRAWVPSGTLRRLKAAVNAAAFQWLEENEAAFQWLEENEMGFNGITR